MSHEPQLDGHGPDCGLDSIAKIMCTHSRVDESLKAAIWCIGKEMQSYGA